LLNRSWTSFFYQFLKNPRQVGAVLPCSVELAHAMRQALEANNSLETTGVVEFGPGTGGITRCLDTNNLTLVEIDQTFCELLKSRYPNAQVINLSAQDFLAQQKTPVCVISSIPLLNNPHAGAIKQAIGDGYRNGVIQKLVTFSYGSKSPFAGCGFAHEHRFKHVLRNMPPANVWVYH
jgi:phosphatidylethanolamine/phosphatidyl-N-methylethanolamine N-methyltransferase